MLINVHETLLGVGFAAIEMIDEAAPADRSRTCRDEFKPALVVRVRIGGIQYLDRKPAHWNGERIG